MSGTALAGHLEIDVSGPTEVTVGEELEITAVVRDADDGSPVEGSEVGFFANSFFAGVAGEIQLGTVETDRNGVANFHTVFSVRGVHRVRVEVQDDAGAEQGAVVIGVDIGPQIVVSAGGFRIPGVGAWVVTFVIGAVWVIMIAAAVWMVRVSRSGRFGDEEDTAGMAGDAPPVPERRRRRFNLAPIVAGAMVLLAVGLLIVLIRSPNTHHNFDPEGYNRSPVAYLDAAYLYVGLGLADGHALTGDAVSDGRALFLRLGCAGCHGLNAEGAAAARSPAFSTRQWLTTVVRTGLPGGMPAYSEIDVSEEQLDTIHAFLLDSRDALAGEDATGQPRATTTTSVAADGDGQTTPTFAQVQEILQPNCSVCHGTAGGWSAADHASVVGSGDNGPSVIPNDPAGSILAQKLLGTQTFGTIMPPGGSLTESEIQLIVDWIMGGALP
jgi:mono/diheme cytochrome c family protein